jgi:hypothetical protein
MNAASPFLLGRFHWFHRSLRTLALALGLAGLGWFLAGCVPTSVHSVYFAADVIQDSALLGVWRDQPDGKEQWTFTAWPGRSYSVEIRSDDQQAVFVGHLFKMAEERFLDLYPSLSSLEDKLEKNVFSAALIPGHLFFRVRATAPKLRLSSLDLDWLKKELNPNSEVGRTSGARLSRAAERCEDECGGSC